MNAVEVVNSVKVNESFQGVLIRSSCMTAANLVDSSQAERRRLRWVTRTPSFRCGNRFRSDYDAALCGQFRLLTYDRIQQ